MFLFVILLPAKQSHSYSYTPYKAVVAIVCGIYKHLTKIYKSGAEVENEKNARNNLF